MSNNNNNSNSDHSSSSGVSSFGDIERPRQIVPLPTMTSDDSNHSTHSHSTPSNSQRPSHYKFKSSIKQRFSADQRIKSSPPPSSDCSKTLGIPIFALHDGGAFYIPLTVEASLLRPQLPFVPDAGPETLLHPVTISVNFNHSSNSVWSHQSPTHQLQ